MPQKITAVSNSAYSLNSDKDGRSAAAGPRQVCDVVDATPKWREKSIGDIGAMSSALVDRRRGLLPGRTENATRAARARKARLQRVFTFKLKSQLDDAHMIASAKQKAPESFART